MRNRGEGLAGGIHHNPAQEVHHHHGVPVHLCGVRLGRPVELVEEVLRRLAGVPVPLQVGGDLKAAAKARRPPIPL